VITDRVIAAIRSAFSKPQPILVFLAGPNGAGKSTFFRNFLEPQLAGQLPFVNADEIGKALREAAPRGSGADYDQLAFAETEELRHSLLAQRLSFCTETVFSDPRGAKLDFLRQAHKAGYAVFMVFVGLDDAQLSLARVMQRVDAGGHDVPDEKVQQRFPRTLANLRAAIEVVDEAFLFDNSSDVQPFRPVAIYSNGKLLERFDPVPPWAEGLPEL
jgi:predicted ABC-type ATPase